MKPKFAVLMAICASSLGTALPAHATAISTGETLIDWSRVMITSSSGTVLPGDVRAQYGDAYSVNNVLPANPSQYSFQSDWLDLPFISNPIMNTNSTAGVANGILTSTASARADGVNTTESIAKGSIGREGTFTVASTGTAAVPVTISLEYSYFVNLMRDAVDEGASAATDIYLWVKEEQTKNEVGATEDRIFNFLDGSVLQDDFSGSNVPLSLQADLAPGTAYRFGVSAQTGNYARAPQQVSEPATLALLGLGLGGLGAAMRRKKQAA